MSIWNTEWLKAYSEHLAYTKKKELKKEELGADAIALQARYEELIEMTPNEIDEVIVPVANMGISNKQYYEIYKQTTPNPIHIESQRPKDITDRLKHSWLNFKDYVSAGTTDFSQVNDGEWMDEVYDVYELARDNKTFVQSLFTFLNAPGEGVQKWMQNNVHTPYFMKQEEMLGKYGDALGITAADLIEFEQEGKNVNQPELKAAALRIATGFAILPEIALRLGPESLVTDEWKASVNRLDIKRDNWLMAKGIVDEDGNPYLYETQLKVILEMMPDAYIDNIKIAEKGKRRPLTESEKMDIAVRTYTEFMGEEVDPNSAVLNALMEGSPLLANRELREGYTQAQVSSNVGDFFSYLITGNMHGRYSPQNVIYESTQDEYDLQMLDVELAFQNNQIDIGTKNELIDKLEGEKDEKLSELSFEANQGVAGILGGFIQALIWIYTDPLVIASKGPGLFAKGTKDLSKTLPNILDEMRKWVDDGEELAEFWIKHEDIVDDLAETAWDLSQNKDVPLFKRLVDQGMHVDFARQVVDAPNQQLIKDILMDAPNQGYLSDMVSGNKSIGKGHQYRIQAKVLTSNLLEAIGRRQADDGFRAAGKRGEGFKEMVNATDLRLPNDGIAGGEVLLTDPAAVLWISKVGNLLRIPDSQLNKLMLDFNTAVRDENWMKAQSIYYDELLLREGSLQLRYLYGMTDEEIGKFWWGYEKQGRKGQTVKVQGALSRAKRGFDDTVGFKSPSKSEPWDAGELALLTKRFFGHQIPASEWMARLFELQDQSIQTLNQLSAYTLEIPNVVKTIKATSQRRRLRANGLIEKEGIDNAITAARKAYDEGIGGTIFDSDTPIGKIITEVTDDIDEAGNLFKGQEKALSTIEEGTFGAVRSVWYPLQLLGRMSYPNKLAIESNFRIMILGLRSFFKPGNPLKFVKLMMNDPDGLLAKVFGSPETSLKGPWRRTAPDFKKYKSLEDKIPASVRKMLNLFTDTSEWGVEELAQVASASPTFTFKRGGAARGTGYELINYRGQVNAPTVDIGETVEFILDPSYIKAYNEYMFEYIDDTLSVFIASRMRKGANWQQISKEIQETPALRQIAENASVQSRDVYRPGTIPIFQTADDYDLFVRNTISNLNNYTGGHDELLEIIATQRVGKVGGKTTVNLREVDSMSPENYSRYSERVSLLVNKYKKDLPTQIPKQIDEVNDLKSYQQMMDGLFHATAQVEFNLGRFPLIKQAYEWYVTNLTNVMTKEALDTAIRNHKDPSSAVNFSDELFEAILKNYEEAKHAATDVRVADKLIPPKVVAVGEDSLSIMGYSADGKLSLNVLKKVDANKDVFELDLNVYNAELKRFKTAKKVAEYRSSHDSEAIGVYSFLIDTGEAIVDGTIKNKDALVTAVGEALNTNNAASLVDDALEYLAKERGKFDAPINRRELFEVLGITGNDVPLSKLQKVLQANKLGGAKKKDVGVSTLERVLGKKVKSRNLFRRKNAIEEKTEQVIKALDENKEGMSYDLADDKLIQADGLYTVPYGGRTVIKPLNSRTLKRTVKKFISDNKTVLSKEDHYLGAWIDEDGFLHLDVSVKLSRGVARSIKSPSNEAVAKAQYLSILGGQKAIGEIRYGKYAGDIDSVVPDAYDVIRKYGQDLLNTKANKKAFPINKAITNARTEGEKVFPLDVLERAGIRAIVDQKAGKVSILNPGKNPIMERLSPEDYQSVLDMNDVKSGMKRMMSYDEVHERSWEYAFELHSRLLYNLTERGYFAQAYRVGFAFFEAWREVMGRYYNLALGNPKAAFQLGVGYRKGVENNIFFEDKYGEKHLIIPVGGTPFEDLIKSEGQGLWTEDMGAEESKVIAKKTMPLNALGVGGGGLFPPIGPAISIPIGLIVRGNPGAKRLLEKHVFGGFELEFAKIDSLGDVPDALYKMTMPSVGKQMLEQLALKLGIKGMDEDMWASSIETSYQITGLLRPDLAQDQQALEEVALILAVNLYQIKAYDRFVRPFAPRLRVMYQIQGNEAAFYEWYGRNGEDSGIIWNNFIELSAIHGFYQDIKDEYVMKLGQQGEFYALLEVSKLLGLDQYDLDEQFTSAALQIKGKNISKGGRMPRTTKEYDFIIDNPELAAEYGPVLVYFAEGLDEGEADMSGYSYIRNLGYITPKSPDEFYLSVQTYLASLLERAMKDYEATVIRNSVLDPGRRADLTKASNAIAHQNIKSRFPMAYGSSAELNKVLGSDYETGVPNEVMVDYLKRAVLDPRFKDFELTDEIKEYLTIRQTVIDRIQVNKLMADETTAINWLMFNDSMNAQMLREELYTQAQIIGRKNDKFLVLFEEVFSYELTRYGVEE